MEKKKLLLFVDWFLPGFAGGGQIRSCANIVTALEGVFDIYVVTRDRDLDAAEPYPGMAVNQWILLGKKARVKYLAPHQLTYRSMRDIIREVRPDCIYLNSMFSLPFTLMPLWAARRQATRSKWVLAPRGMLQRGAMQFKRLKKSLFLKLFRWSGFTRSVIFHATDPVEARDLRSYMGRSAQIRQVDDFPTLQQAPWTSLVKKPGQLTCLFISRIVEKKNLLYALELLEHIQTGISLTIVGPVEDQKYWDRCQEAIRRLPSGIRVNYLGALRYEALPDIYRDHHLFLFPTQGENFGHVIFDALVQGRPVLISDQTPWRGLETVQAGMDRPLSSKPAFVQALQQFLAMDQQAFDRWSHGAWDFAARKAEGLDSLKRAYTDLFQ